MKSPGERETRRSNDEGDPSGFDALLYRALDLPAETRREVLLGEGADAALLEEVLDLVEGENRLDDFLGRSAATLLGLGSQADGISPQSAEKWAEATDPLPKTIGPYCIDRRLGAGGMGVVYAAEQTEPIHRRLAIKVVHPARLDTETRARFLAERKALARMTHPNIAQMVEAGTTESGQPYFAMELVEGEPITHYCDRAELDLRDRIGLFVTVCRAVEHAHQRGILHRDLKPPNILVAEIDGQPLPKIIDFGIAKSLDHPPGDATQLTVGHAVGTPTYMSPEAFQADPGGPDLDTRSDVYTLGIVLYEVLAGCHPFDTKGSTLSQVLRSVLHEDAPRPSERLSSLDAATAAGVAERRRLPIPALRRRLADDLDWIVTKAIARHRGERYGSAGALAADLERHLKNEPVEAGPPTTRYRLGKLVRRHRSAFVASTLGILGLVLGSIVATLGWLRANEQATAARRALEEAEQVSAFLVEVFEAADPAEAAGKRVDARQLLARGAETIDARFPDQPLARARFMQTIGDIYVQLGLHDEATALIEGAVELRRSHLGTEDLDLASSLRGLGVLHWRLGHYPASLEAYGQALEIQLALLGEAHAEVANTIHNMGVASLDSGDPEAARERFEQAYRIRFEVLGPDHADLAKSHNALGAVHAHLGDPRASEPHYLRALEIREKHLGPEHPHLAFSLNNLCNMYRQLARFDEAEPPCQRALAIWERSHGEEHPNIGLGSINLARLYQRWGHPEKSETLFRRGLAIYERTLGSDHPKTISTHNSLGLALLDAGRFAEAEAQFRPAFETARDAVAGSATHLTIYQANLGRALWHLGRWQEAEIHLRAAFERWQEETPDTDPRKIDNLVALAGLSRDQGRFGEAEQLYDRARLGAGASESLLPEHRSRLWRDYAELLRRTGRTEEARAAEAEADRFPAPGRSD